MSKINKKSTRKTLALLMVFVMMFAVFGPISASAADEEGNVAQFTYRGTVYAYPTIAEAIEDAGYFGNPDIYVTASHTLPGPLTIPANQKVVIPTSSDYNDTNTGVNNVNSGIASGKANVTLTIPKDVTLTVNGTLLVAGNQQSTTGNSGFRTGDYGAITLGGTIDVGSGGVLYARGLIDGTGSVNIANGGTVYERFEIADWRGGRASESAFNQHIFPFNLYQLGGISCDLVVKPGAFVYGQSYIYAATLSYGAVINVPYVGNADHTGTDYDVKGSIFVFSNPDATEGSLTFSNSDDGKTTITIKDVTAETGNISYVVKIFGFDLYNFSSEDTDCPFGYKTDVVLSNSTVDIKTKVKILPGSSFTVGAGSTLNITDKSAMYFYGADTYKATYCQSIPAGWDVNLPAVLQVDGGTVTNQGILASSSLGETIDNIKGLGEITKGEEVTVNEVTQSGTSVTVVPVPFYKAVLPTTDPTPAE